MHDILNKLDLNTKNTDFYKHKLMVLGYEVTEFNQNLVKKNKCITMKTFNTSINYSFKHLGLQRLCYKSGHIKED